MPPKAAKSETEAPKEPKCRSIWTGDPEEYAKVLKPFATHPGWIQGDESDHVGKAKVKDSDIESQHKFLVAQRELQVNLSFNKSTIKAGLEIILKTKAKTWRLNEAEAADWTKTVTNRIANLNRKVGCGPVHAATAKWHLDLPWNQNGERPAKKAKKVAAPAGGPLRPDFVYGFDSEVLLAYRQELKYDSKGRHIGVKVTSLPLEITEKAGPGDPVVAEFADGDRHEIPGLSQGRLQSLVGRGGGGGGGRNPKESNVLWTGTHAETNHTITVAQRVDRALLLSVYEQARQVLMVRQNLFGPVPDEHQQSPLDDPTLQKALAFTKKIAASYANGEVAVAGLKDYRDAGFRRLGIQPTQRGRVAHPERRPHAEPAVADADGDTGAADATAAQSRGGVLKRPSGVLKRPCGATKRVTFAASVDTPAQKPSAPPPFPLRRSNASEDLGGSVPKCPTHKGLRNDVPPSEDTVAVLYRFLANAD